MRNFTGNYYVKDFVYSRSFLLNHNLMLFIGFILLFIVTLIMLKSRLNRNQLIIFLYGNVTFLKQCAMPVDS